MGVVTRLLVVHQYHYTGSRDFPSVIDQTCFKTVSGLHIDFFYSQRYSLLFLYPIPLSIY